MSLKDLHEFFDSMLRLNHLPAFFCGLVLGFSCIPILVKLVKNLLGGTGHGELRAQIDKLTHECSEVRSTNEHLQDQKQAIEQQRALLEDRTKIQDGQIEVLRQQAIQLSADCEARATKLIDVGHKLKAERRARKQFHKQVQVYSKQLDDIDNSDGKIWDKRAPGTARPFLPLSMRKTAIISLVNLKGGVGKTTITANLGAAMASEGLRVLLIDLDHQGSLSNLCLGEEEKLEVKKSHRYVDEFFEEGGDLAAFRQGVTRLKIVVGKGQLHLASVQDVFSDIETRLQARWMVGLTGDDVRFRLRGALHNPKLRDFYDVILIDCPPRWSTGSVNAIAASDYVLIPVLLEQTSAEAVPRILGWLKQFQENCCPELDVLGVVGNRATNRDPLIAREQLLWNELADQGRDAWKGHVRLFPEIIRDHPAPRGTFAALDPKYQPRYMNLIHQIRQAIPHAHLQPATVPPLAGAPVGGGGH